MGQNLRRLPHQHPLETPLLAYGFAIFGAMVSGLFDHFYFNLTFMHIAVIYWLVMGLGMRAVWIKVRLVVKLFLRCKTIFEFEDKTYLV